MDYAIDFGTSNTVVSRRDAEGAIATVKLPGLSSAIAGNPPLIPSLVFVQNAATDDVWVGQEAIDRGLDVKGNPRFFQSFKRAIGTPVPGFVPEIDDRALSFETIGGWFLDRVFQQLFQQLTDADSLTLTVPVDSFEPYRQWLGAICDRWRVKRIRLLDEPTAAALGYGVVAVESDRTATLVLVIDFGGGTLDLSLVQLLVPPISPNPSPFGFLLKWGDRTVPAQSNRLSGVNQRSQTAKVVAKFGQNLGGIDIDNWIADYFQYTQGVPKNSLVLRLCERLKIALSHAEAASDVLFDDRTFASYDLALDRSQLQALLDERGFFIRLNTALERVKQQTQQQGIDWQDIQAVLLVGGTAQIPAVRHWAQQHFPEEKIKGDKPFEAIAHGALARGWELQDYLYHSYGIRYWDRRFQRHGWHTIVRAGQAYPMTNPVELVLGASMPNQPSIEVVIGELGETDVEVYFDGDRLVARSLAANQQSVQALNDREGGRTLATLEPLGNPGSDRIKVAFTVDEKRTLRVTVADLLTDKVLLSDRPVVQLI